MACSKVFVYCRRSNEEEPDSPSIADQESACRKFAKRHRLEVAGVFSDADASGRFYPAGCEEKSRVDFPLRKWLRSNSSGEVFRGGLGDLLRRLGEIDGVLVMDLSRLYQPLAYSNLANTVNYELASNGVLLYSAKEGAIDLGGGPGGEARPREDGGKASDGMEKCFASLRAIRDDGYIPTMPKMYGIRYIGGPERTVEVIPGCDEVIRFVFASILKHTPYNRILREMNERFPDHVQGKAFYGSSWRNIVKQPFYCGYMYDGAGELIRARQMIGKEIVSLQDWRRAMEIVGSPRRRKPGAKTRVHPFSGILTCGHCGARLLTGMDKGKEFYHCVTGRDKGDGECRWSRVTLNLVRRSEWYTGLREAMCPFLALGLYHRMERLIRVLGDVHGISERKAKIEKYEQRRNEIAEAYQTGAIDSELCERAEAILDRKIRETREQILEMESIAGSAGQDEAEIRSRFADLDRLMGNELDDATYKRLLNASVDSIACYQDHVVVNTVYGAVDLPRYIDKHYRNFPRFTYAAHPAKDFLRNLPTSRLEIHYHYGGDTRRKLVANFKFMRIHVEE